MFLRRKSIQKAYTKRSKSMKILFKNNCKKAGENNSKKIFKKFQKKSEKNTKKI
jgi:hypothetical protein